jgi:hypothetical protein
MRQFRVSLSDGLQSDDAGGSIGPREHDGSLQEAFFPR